MKRFLDEYHQEQRKKQDGISLVLKKIGSTLNLREKDDETDSLSYDVTMPTISEASSTSNHIIFRRRPVRSIEEIQEAAQSIVNDQKAWNELRETLRSSNVVTSVAVSMICVDILRDRADEIEKERLEALQAKEKMEKEKNVHRNRYSLDLTKFWSST